MKDGEPLQDWETQLHRELMELPELEAPSTLLPAVLRRIQAPAPTPWYHSPWWHWPLMLRWASAGLMLAFLGALVWFGMSWGGLELGPALVQAGAEVKAGLAFALTSCEPVLGSGAAFWGQHGQAILIVASALLLATYLTCVAAGTALYQLAWKRSS